MNTEDNIKVKNTYSIKKIFQKNKPQIISVLCLKYHPVYVYNGRMTRTWTIHTMEQYHPSCASRPIKHTPVRVLCNDNIVHWTLYEHKTVLVAIAHQNTTTTVAITMPFWLFR